MCLPPWALVRAQLAHDADLPLPEVRHSPGGRPRRQLNDQWPGLAEVNEIQYIGGRGVGADEPEPAGVGEVTDEVVVRRPEQVAMHMLPLRVGDQRQRPQVGLRRHLVVQLVEDQADITATGKLPRHAHRAEPPGKLVI